MNINTVAKQLLTHFPPEMRDIPDHADFPDCNEAILTAMNLALQEMFTDGGLFVRKGKRGHLTFAPTTIDVEVLNGSKSIQLPTSNWLDVYAGCSIAITGSDFDNEIRAWVGTTSSGSNFSLVGGSLQVVPGVAMHLTVSDSFPAPEVGSLLVMDEVAGSSLTLGDIPVVARVVTAAATVFGQTSISFALSDVDVALPSVSSTLTGGFISEDTKTVARLKLPHDGPTGTTSATIYCDCVTIDSDVLELVNPIKVNGRKVYPVPGGMSGLMRRGDEDYGFHRRSSSEIGVLPRIGNMEGPTLGFDIETYSPSDTEEPVTRLKIFPPQKGSGRVEYDAKIAPPELTDIASTATLPIPHKFVQSVFYPIARYHLSACPFYRAGSGERAVEQSYQAAKLQIKKLNPRKNSGVRFRTRY